MRKLLHILMLMIATMALMGAAVYSGGKLADRIITVDYAHHETHEGNHYQASIQNTLASGGISNTIINTPAANFVHLLIPVDAQGELVLEIYRTPTCSSLGNQETVSNMNDISSNTAGTEIYTSSTCSSAGTLIPGWSQKFGSGQQTGGESRAENEHNLRQSTLYLVKMTSRP